MSYKVIYLEYLQKSLTINYFNYSLRSLKSHLITKIYLYCTSGPLFFSPKLRLSCYASYGFCEHLYGDFFWVNEKNVGKNL